MTAAQRRAINRMNAQKSTGPKTSEGKERSRQNALKHGLCAAQLALSTEDADELQNEIDQWIEQYQPVGLAEYAMVEEIVKNQLKLRRCARREAAVAELQILVTARTLVYEQDDRVRDLKALLATDPDRAVSELLRFKAGRDYLSERWERLASWFLRDGYCQAPALVDEAVRLLGADPEQLPKGSVVAYKLAVCCAAALPTPDHAALKRLFSDTVIHPEYLAEFGRALPPPEMCREEVRALVKQQIEMMEQIETLAQEVEGGPTYSRAQSSAALGRAAIPAADPETKHALRYESQARSALHKALKELDRLQDQRFAVEAETRNEADTPPESPPSPEPVGTCDASEHANPDAPNAGGTATISRASSAPLAPPLVPAVPSRETPVFVPRNRPVVPVVGMEAPPA